MTSSDTKRLGVQREDVLAVMLDGAPRTFEEIQSAVQARTGRRHPEASISARLRDLRHARYGGYIVDHRPRWGNLNEYRVRPAEPSKAEQIPMFEGKRCLA